MKSILLSAMLCGTACASAQPGRIGIGTRGSLDGFGCSGKFFLDQAFAMEGQLNAGGVRVMTGNSYYFTGLIEYHLSLPVSTFRIYFGGGVHAGYWSNRENTAIPDEIMAGLTGIGGIEYMFQHFPAGISGDIRPSVNYLQEVEFFPHNLIGLGLRYYFGSNKVKAFQYPAHVR